MKELEKSQFVLLLESRILPHCSELGYDLVEIQTEGGTEKQIAVFVFKNGGVDVDSLAVLNRRIYSALEPLPELQDGFSLEVSSPGIFRELKYTNEFLIFMGLEMQIMLNDGSTITTTVSDLRNSKLICTGTKDGPAEIDISNVKKAVLNG